MTFREVVKKVFDYSMGALTDPVTLRLSGTRVSGMVCLVSGNALAWFRPNQPAAVATLISGGAVALLTRTKASDVP